jgi:hypothetical protein
MKIGVPREIKDKEARLSRRRREPAEAMDGGCQPDRVTRSQSLRQFAALIEALSEGFF